MMAVSLPGDGPQMSKQTDSPHGEHGSEVEEESKADGMTTITPCLTLVAKGKAVQSQEREGTSARVTQKDVVTLEIEQPLPTQEALMEAASIGSSRAAEDYCRSEAVQWVLDQRGLEDLDVSYQDAKEWDVEITGSVRAYLDLWSKASSEVKKQSGSYQADTFYKSLYSKGLFCDSLLLAWVEQRKQAGEDYQELLTLLEEEEQDD